VQTDKDSTVALKFDQVVGQTLAGMKDPKQRQQVLAWVQQQEKAERDRQLGGTVGTIALGLGAVLASGSGYGVLAFIFGGSGTILGGATAVDGLNQAGVSLDAVQAGEAGGQQLTAANPHQARMNYQLALVNVGLALVDAGVAVNSIRQVLSAPQTVQALSKLKPNQLGQFSKAAQLQQTGKTTEAQKLLQQLKNQVGEPVYKVLLRIHYERLRNPEAGMVRLGGEANLPIRLKTPNGNPLPYGFKSYEQYKDFAKLLRTEAPAGTTVLFQGSAVTGKSYKTGEAFDVGRLSDFDIALANQSLFKKARELGYKAKDGSRIGPLKDEQLRDLGLLEYAKKVRKNSEGRTTEFMLFDSPESAYSRPSIEALLEEEGL
jgi:hypothetical protein